MIQALLVGLTVVILGFIECWCCFPMVERPLIVGTAIGIVLGDVKTGVEVGASLELVFMGVMAIGGTVPPHLHWQFLHLLSAKCSLYQRSQYVHCIHLLLTRWWKKVIIREFKGYSH